MSTAECLALQTLGNQWYATVNLQGDGVQRALNRNGLLGQLTNTLPAHITVKRGFQDYDPVVRVSGIAYKYSDIAGWAANQADGGLLAAQLFGAWVTRDDVTLANLPPQLQALAVITSFAEAARNLYNPLQLANWINGVLQASDIAGRGAAWRDHDNQFAASTTYKTDVVSDWS